jgi:S1-C subfamily serine protease
MPLSGVTDDGRTIPFAFVSKDTATQLVLLKTNSWVAGSARPLRAPDPQDPESGPLIAILPSGPMRMAYVSRHRYGVLNPSRRLVPLTEIHFESPQQAVGGALIVTESGELLGSLNATLSSPDSQTQLGANNQTQNVTTQSAGQNSVGGQGGAGGFGGAGGGFGGGGGRLRPYNNAVQNANAGPGQLAVAYTVGPEVVRHALEGFLSSSHQVEYAAIGIFCTDNPGGGALIQQVTPGSPAAKAGLKPGDILQSIGPSTIADQVAFGTVMLQQKVGKEIALMIHRGHATLVIDIVPEKAAN